MGLLICLCCEKEFEPTCHKSRQKFCSEKCRVKYHNAKRYLKEETENCLECDERLEHSGEAGRRRQFCSERCRRIFHYKKRQEKKHSIERPKQICPNCGMEFGTDWSQKQRRFCCDACRIEWWSAYHKAHPAEIVEDKLCEWCSKKFSDFSRFNEKYCGAACSIAAQHEMSAHPKARRQFSYHNPDQWCDKLTSVAKKNVATGKHEQRVFLVCGITSMYVGLDGLLGIIEHKLCLNPFDSNLYVFCDLGCTMLKYIEWDGAGFTISKRRSQSGSYPWPPADAGSVIEITKKEFLFLRQKSIVPSELKKLQKTEKNSDKP